MQKNLRLDSYYFYLKINSSFQYWSNTSLILRIKQQTYESDNEGISDRRLDIAFTSKQEIEEAYPYMRSRDIFDRGVEGPKESEKDELELLEKNIEIEE